MEAVAQKDDKPSGRWKDFHWDWPAWRGLEISTSEGKLRLRGLETKFGGNAELFWTCAEEG